MLQLHLSDQQFYCQVGCDLYKRFYGIFNRHISTICNMDWYMSWFIASTTFKTTNSERKYLLYHSIGDILPFCIIISPLHHTVYVNVMLLLIYFTPNGETYARHALDSRYIAVKCNNITYTKAAMMVKLRSYFDLTKEILHLALACRLSHLPLDKMAAILQTTSSNAFSWKKSYVFWFEFHWSLFLRVQLTMCQHWFR